MIRRREFTAQLLITRDESKCVGWQKFCPMADSRQAKPSRTSVNDSCQGRNHTETSSARQKDRNEEEEGVHYDVLEIKYVARRHACLLTDSRQRTGVKHIKSSTTSVKDTSVMDSRQGDPHTKNGMLNRQGQPSRTAVKDIPTLKLVCWGVRGIRQGKPLRTSVK